jgi:F420-non-reducing hydrogenase iron-sulfur subunit
VSRFQYPPNIEVVRVPCTGRVNPLFVLRSLQRGADGVLVAGCYPGECNYSTGNLYARRKFMILSRYLEFLGLEKGRFHVAWLSSAEAERFVKIAKNTIESVKKLGPAEKLIKEGFPQ